LHRLFPPPPHSAFCRPGSTNPKCSNSRETALGLLEGDTELLSSERKKRKGRLGDQSALMRTNSLTTCGGEGADSQDREHREQSQRAQE